MDVYTNENKTANEERRAYRKSLRQARIAKRRMERLKTTACMVVAAISSATIIVLIMNLLKNYIHSLSGIFFTMIMASFVGLVLFSVFFAILAIAFVRGKQ